MANTHRPPVAPRIAAQLAPRYAPPKLAAARKVAAASQRVVLMVAGLPMVLKEEQLHV